MASSVGATVSTTGALVAMPYDLVLCRMRSVRAMKTPTRVTMAAMLNMMVLARMVLVHVRKKFFYRGFYRGFSYFFVGGDVWQELQTLTLR